MYEMSKISSLFQGRIDDNDETVKTRLKVFKELSLPVVKYYSKKGILHTVITDITIHKSNGLFFVLPFGINSSCSSKKYL